MAAWGQRTGGTDYAPNSATDRVVRLCTQLVSEFHPLRTPMPLLALHAVAERGGTATADDDVRKGVEFLRELHLRRGLRCRVVEAERAGDDFQRGLAVLVDLAGKPWESRHRPHSETYAFPRSGLLEAVEQVVAAEDEQGVLPRLERMRWRPRATGDAGDGWAQQALRAAMSPANLVGAAVVATLGGVAAVNGVLVVGLLAGLLLVALGGAWSRHHEGLLPWHGPAGRWLATTTFVAAASESAPVWSIWRPRQSRATRAARVHEVARTFRRACEETESPQRERARQFYLELRTLALLDDLRHNFRPRPLLRVRRHATPPVVFVPRACRANGGITLLRVISDVRSRRSELDPLLVVAGLTRADEAELHVRSVLAPAFTHPDTDPDPTALYWAWVRDHLRVGQSPSAAASLPWVLPIRLPAALLDATGTQAHDASPIGPPTWVRGAPRALAVLTVTGVLTGAGMYAGAQPENCDHRRLHAFDRATEVVEGECVGISDGNVVFAPDGGVRLDGRAYGTPGDGKGAAGTDLARLMERIADENADARSGRHVVVFYAGELSTGGERNAVTALNGLRELAGVHARQKALNARDGAGDAEHPEVVVEVANGGHLMRQQAKAVTRIVDYAHDHPDEVLGVVGFSRDDEETHGSVRRLLRAGLNVLSPQNSDDRLASRYTNYFGLAATNKEEARAFQEAVDSGRVAVEPGEVLILTPRGTRDMYSRQQADDAEAALEKTAKLTAARVVYDDVAEVREELCDRDEVTALYFTGRAEKLPELADAVSESDCVPEKLTIMTGDDASKTLATASQERLTGDVTLYYAALAAPEHTLPSSTLPTHIAAVLGGEAPRESDPLFDDGTMALAYDATTVLYDAAKVARFRPEFVNGELLKRKNGKGAGGRIDLSPDRRRAPCGHTVALFEVYREAGVQHTVEADYRGLGGKREDPCPPAA
ncbi:hypothetical protein [Streptomyces griseoruber]|uniref:Uncharacterized protein n=1 Tax=Streptomyces griseoruber TaxID=1943 RepID=A0A101TAV8_9ACTN|nr:hypothetical protein [Streptomyces griseoruber]KUN88810.1 hypothetical protein AQJ64_02345 [Streptomyces griseoruber]